MKEIIENINDYLEDVKMQEITDEQRKWIRERFNTSVKFEYGLTSTDDFIFKITEDYFKSMEYYMGLEYERNEIILEIKYRGDVIIIYNGFNERITKIFEYLMPEKFCDEE